MGAARDSPGAGRGSKSGEGVTITLPDRRSQWPKISWKLMVSPGLGDTGESDLHRLDLGLVYPLIL